MEKKPVVDKSVPKLRFTPTEIDGVLHFIDPYDNYYDAEFNFLIKEEVARKLKYKLPKKKKKNVLKDKQ